MMPSKPIIVSNRPSCHQKRVVGFGEWLCTEVLKHVQSFGDFQNFNPHLHALATDGCFYHDAAFMVCPPPDTGELEKLFR